MAERKSGPVKPPVIDLEARPAETAEPKPESARPRAEATPRPTPRPAARLAMPWSAISIAAVLGALLGTCLTYTLVRVLPLPDNRPQIADPAPALADQSTRIEALTTRLAALETEGSKTAADLKSTADTLTSGLNETKAAIAGLPQPTTVDLGPTDQRLGALETQVAALGAGASSPDAAALGTKVSELETRLAALEKRPVTPAVPAVPAADVTALKSDIETLKQAVAARAPSLAEGEVSAAVRLPLLVAGLDSAFGNGRPYADVLKSLTPLLPATKVPDGIAAAAETGLPAPATVAERVSAVVPDMLAKRSVTASGDLVTDSIDWFKGLIALRPSGDVTGDTPEALVARIEAAAQRADWAGTAELFSKLPVPMRLAAGDVVGDVSRLAEAQAFIETLRRDALAPATETAQ